MYVITGAAGFIPSALVAYLNERGVADLILVDDFVHYQDKTPNLEGKQFLQKVERDDFFTVWDREKWPLTGVYHLGARTDTAETNEAIFDKLNLEYSREIWQRCSTQKIPLVYASSAATYGLGEHGYEDRHDVVDQLEPLNAYGRSKNDFDKWALDQATAPPAWYGLKFFNVYGPNEYHKGRMASVIWHTFRQVKATGAMKLFRSHRADVADGHQQRDFIYVMDLCKVMHWLMDKQPPEYGLYNLGTGRARTFLDLAKATFGAMNRQVDIGYVDTPADIREKYQYYTQADMSKLRQAGYTEPFASLEEGVNAYVTNYLTPERYY
ncbi:ADP-glyceromanno-heptose 6-epimerase [Neolewinella antarctica]|uniref:ADP-L-glycero-D-manno-heptose-6-epimerase n=1 Tax=Neolewinella antarctica TaxID=442734 RepID=A0ABX0XBI6_9BACT|nr:ADP-glyceromanno-heptose 6-epimerase [Neolewinella antarctica]NJC26193.1 ADP-L-glycero-D-manno-heptose 6-epimerase [Neolewinella antarctica]